MDCRSLTRSDTGQCLVEPPQRLSVFEIHVPNHSQHVAGLAGAVADQTRCRTRHSSAIGRKTSFAMSVTASRGVKRSPPPRSWQSVEVGGGSHESLVSGSAQAVLVRTAAERLYHDGRWTAHRRTWLLRFVADCQVAILGPPASFVRHIGSEVADKPPGDPKSRAIVTTDDLSGSEQAQGTSS